jgi:transposase-like protein
MAKSKYEEYVLPKLFLVESWARDGVIDADIARKLGISKDTFYKYKTQYVAFADALKKGKEVIDFEVENALLKRALGYEYEEVKTYIQKDDKGKETKRVEKTIKHFPADTTAQIFWLKNRKRKEWTTMESEKLSMDREKLEIEKKKNETAGIEPIEIIITKKVRDDS